MKEMTKEFGAWLPLDYLIQEFLGDWTDVKCMSRVKRGRLSLNSKVKKKRHISMIKIDGKLYTSMLSILNYIQDRLEQYGLAIKVRREFNTLVKECQRLYKGTRCVFINKHCHPEVLEYARHYFNQQVVDKLDMYLWDPNDFEDLFCTMVERGHLICNYVVEFTGNDIYQRNPFNPETFDIDAVVGPTYYFVPELTKPTLGRPRRTL